jgi:hypothetical protein
MMNKNSLSFNKDDVSRQAKSQIQDHLKTGHRSGTG